MSIRSNSTRLMALTTAVLWTVFHNSLLQSADDSPAVADAKIQTENRQLQIVKSRVNWDTRTLTLGVASPEELRTALGRDGLPAGRLQVIASSKRSAEGNRLSAVVAPIDAFLEAARLDTRSVWFAGMGEDNRFRLDLPTPEITGLSVAKGEGAGQGPKVRLTVTGLLPGFRVMHHDQIQGGESSDHATFVPERSLPDVGWEFPHLSSIDDASEGSHYIWMQLAETTDSPLAHSFCIVNPDGSRSRTLALTQRDRGVDRAIEKPFPARSTPVDARATVPSVELLNVAQALLRASDAGLQPVLVDLQTLREVPTGGQVDEVVVRQGLPAGHVAQQGELLLLGIGKLSEPKVEIETEFVLGEVDRAPPIDTESEGGVATTAKERGPIDFEPDRELGPDGGESAFPPDQHAMPSPEEMPEWEAPPPLEFEPDAEFTGASESRPVETDPDNPLGALPGIGSINPDGAFAPDHPLAPSGNPGPGGPGIPFPQNPCGTGGGIGIPFPPQEGVVLTPQRPTVETLLGAVLRRVLEAIIARFGIQQLPGPIGQAINEAVALYEQALTEGLTQHFAVEALPAEAILHLTCARVGVTLTPEQHKLALQQWQAYAAVRLSREYLDENGNQLVADDTVVWFVCWLQQNALYNPARHFRIANNSLGQPVVVIPPKDIDPHWVERIPIEGILGGENEGLRKPKTTPQGQTPSAPAEPLLPTAPAVVTFASTPDLVRVPELVEQPVDRASQKLAAVGLRTNPSQKLLPQDRIVSTNPQENRWVKPLTTVSLEVSRRVPNVVGSHSKAAVQLLKGQEFDPRPIHQAKYRNDDIILGQDPEAGTYAARHTAVLLNVQRKVPHLIGMSASEAHERIVKDGFRPDLPEGIIGSDIVVEQEPSEIQKGTQPTYARPGELVRIVRVETLVPDLQGASLGSAKTLTEAKRLLAKVGLGFKFAGPETDYAQAKVLRQSPDPNQRVDRNRGQVSLQMVVPVPDLTKQYSVGKAERILTELGLRPTTSIKEYRSNDIVAAQDVTGQTHRAGKEMYCLPGTEVRLTVGRVVPDVSQLDWESAIIRLNDAGFQHGRDSGQRTGTHVIATTPAGGKLADPRQPVSLHPGIRMPDLRNQRIEDAVAVVQGNGMRVNVVRGGKIEAPSPDLIGVSIVREQSYSSGRLLPMSTSIVIGLQTVEFVEPRVPVPGLVGMHPDEAREAANASRLQYQTRSGGSVPTTDPRMDGEHVVTNQHPRPGIAVSVGTPIMVQVGRYELRVPVPNLVGLDPQRARQIADQAGFQMKVVRQVPIPSTDRFIRGRDLLEFDVLEVVNQAVRPGTTAPRGTTISVVVGKYTWQRQTPPEYEGNPNPEGYRQPHPPGPRYPEGPASGYPGGGLVDQFKQRAKEALLREIEARRRLE